MALMCDINVSNSCTKHWSSLRTRSNFRRSVTSTNTTSVSFSVATSQVLHVQHRERGRIHARTLLEMTKILGVQSESVEFDIWRNKERKRRVISERRWLLQCCCKWQKHWAGVGLKRKTTMPGLKLYYGLNKCKRPEVISRLIQGQLNFLPRRTGTIRHTQLSAAFSGPHQPQSAQSINQVSWVFPHNPAAVTAWSRLPEPDLQ